MKIRHNKYKIKIAFNCKFKYFGRHAEEYVKMAAPLIEYSGAKKINEIWFGDCKPPRDGVAYYKAYLMDSMGRAHMVSQKVVDELYPTGTTLSWVSVNETAVKLRVLYIVYRIFDDSILVINDPNLVDDSSEVSKTIKTIPRKDFYKKIR